METRPLIDPLVDYEYFARMDYWTTGEAASLTLGLDPESAHSVESQIAVEIAVCDAIVGDFIEDQLYKSTTDDLPDILKRLIRMVTLIERSADNGSLPIRFENPGAMLTLFHWDRYQFLVLDFINWAESRGIDLPKQLIEAARKYHVSPANEDLKSPDCSTDERKRIMRETGEEVKILHEALKKNGYDFPSEEAREKVFQKIVVETFEENRKEFKYIKRDYLDDEDCYFFRDGHERGDFYGKLLCKVLKQQNLPDSSNYQGIYTEFIKLGKETS